MTSKTGEGRRVRKGQGRKVAPESEMASAYKSIKSSEKGNAGHLRWGLFSSMKWKLTLPSLLTLLLTSLLTLLLLLFTCSNEMRNNALKLHFNECEEAGSVLAEGAGKGAQRERGRERRGRRQQIGKGGSARGYTVQGQSGLHADLTTS